MTSAVRIDAYATSLRYEAYDLVVLSPHFDDAVYSLAATISRARSEDRRVCVVTVFGHGKDVAPSGTGSYDDYATREAEDRAAMEALDADYVWLNRPEWTFRTSRGIELTAELLPHVAFRGTKLLDETTRALGLALASLMADGATVYAPLAVGAHPDHRIVHEAARSLSSRYATRYYEDVPYALDDAMVEARLAVLCSLPGPRPLRLARASAKLIARGLLRLVAVAPLLVYHSLAEVHRRFRKSHEKRIDPLTLRSFDHDIARFAREKANAVALYATQTALFFEPTIALESQLGRGRPDVVERSWRIAP